MTTIDIIIIIIIIIHKRQPRGHRLTTNSVYLRQEVGGKVQIGENVQHRNGQTTVCHHQLPITDIPLRVYMSVCVCFTITSLSAQSNLGRGLRHGAVANVRREVPVGYNGAPQIRPQKYPFPWTDPQTPLPASSLDPSDLWCQTASGSDPPFFHNALDRPTDACTHVRTDRNCTYTDKTKQNETKASFRCLLCHPAMKRIRSMLQLPGNTDNTVYRINLVLKKWQNNRHIFFKMLYSHYTITGKKLMKVLNYYTCHNIPEAKN